LANDSLPKLINLICSDEYVKRDAVRALLHNAFDLSYDTIPIEEGVERYLAEKDIVSAIKDFIPMPLILKVIEAEGDKDRSKSARTTSHDAAAHQLMSLLDIPLKPEPRRLLGASSVLRELQEMRNDLSALHRYGLLREQELRGFPLSGWAYIEHVLHTIIDYYSKAFDVEMTDLSDSLEELNNSLQHAIMQKEKGLRNMLQAMRGIEKKFKSDDLQQECMRICGRRSPFSGFPFDDYENETVVQKFRNFFAHNISELVKQEGIDRAKDSLDSAIELVNDLLDNQVCPSVAFIVGYESDVYKRIWIRMVSEDYVHLPEPDRHEMEFRIFKRSYEIYDIYTPYMIPSDISKVYFEPMIVPMPDYSQVR